MAAESKQDADIRKFEEIGTHPAANHNAIAEALTFHEGIGIERKAARLRYLKDPWARRLEAQKGVRVLTLHGSKGLEFDFVWIAHMDERATKEKINIIAIAQGSSELTIAIVVRRDGLEAAVRAVHAECGMGKGDRVQARGKRRK